MKVEDEVSSVGNKDPIGALEAWNNVRAYANQKSWKRHLASPVCRALEKMRERG
jgi:hypothetical protein